MKRVAILDTEVDCLDRQEARRRLSAALENPKSPAILVVTVNPEILLLAHKDREYRSILARADLTLADGVGVIFAACLSGERLYRITGRDILGDILSISVSAGAQVRLILRRGGLTSAEKAASCLERRFPSLRLETRELRPDERDEPHESEVVISTFGAPEQERWLEEQRKAFPRARILIGVGGALDALCGSLPAPPRVLSVLGLEWFWRLMVQPWRWRRILRAVLVFPATCLVHRWLHREGNR